MKLSGFHRPGFNEMLLDHRWLVHQRDQIRVVQPYRRSSSIQGPLTKAKMWPVASAWTKFLRNPPLRNAVMASYPTAIMLSALAALLHGGKQRTSRRMSSSEFLFFPLLPFVHIKLYTCINCKIFLTFFVFKIFYLNRGCPQCRVKSSFYIPSKHWVCDGEEKASLIAAFKERSRLEWFIFMLS